ncbi:hypothetical protein R3P38DRAFT_3293203 [Favolaschia claudopus]|uniref:RPN1 N-terminal domain-containing protein n=1 Tax=Favolaschia claudopus TaxID=2862362 RepID=A0AAV9ZIN3_9AGAR
MEDDGQGEVEVILRTFNIPGADATVDELREALRDTQLQLARTQVELRAYQTIAQTTSGSKEKVQANPHNYLDAIQALEKKDIDAIFKSSKLYNNLLTCTLYEHVPVKFHSLVDGSSFPGFKDNFLKYMSSGRSNFVERLKGSWEKLQTESEMKKTPEEFLYFPGDDKSKLPLLSPPIYYSGLKKDAKGCLLNPILPLSLRCLLYGLASIKDKGKAKPTSKTYGVMRNIQELTIESISFVLIAIFFVLSDKDTSFEEKGKTSHIPYQSHFHAHKTRLMKYRNTAGVRNIIRFWSEIVFAGVSRTVTETLGTTPTPRLHQMQSLRKQWKNFRWGTLTMVMMKRFHSHHGMDGLADQGYATLRTLIRTFTSSMTSVPKPLKFLRPLYPWPASDDKSLFADILSVLAMTYSDTQPRGTLRYRLLASSSQPEGSPLADPGTWGHEYVRHLAAELGDEYTFRETEVDDAPTPEPASTICVLWRENGIAQLVDDDTFNRVCQYMIRCVNLLPPPDDISFLWTAHKIYVQHRKFPEALALAIRLGDPALVREDFQRTRKPTNETATSIPPGAHATTYRVATHPVRES